jgi:pimeloyl-ACP methyl ester carboxylesterase
MKLDSSRQFRVLYRDFLRRMVDLELLSSQGDAMQLAVQFGALLAAFSLVLTIYLLPIYARSPLRGAELLRASWGTEEFLISTTMTVVGMLAIVSWDSLLPGRADSLVLGLLPVSVRIIFRAKAAALATALGVAIAVVNCFTGLTIPLAAGVRAALVYWVTMLAAGAFVFCALLALQGIAAQIFGHRGFLRVSNVLQTTSFFAILAVYFLAPGPSEMSLDSAEGQRIVHALPSFWFLALLERLSGASEPALSGLATRALVGLAIALGLAAITYTLSYARTVRRMVEQPDILPSDRKHQPSKVLPLVARKLSNKPLEQAILLFTARTIGRSRQHRNILAVFGGIGLAICLTFTRSMIYGNTEMYALARRYGFHVAGWDEPNVPFLACGLVMLLLGAIGVRAVFALPTSLKANWIFRFTAVHSPAAYFAAVRRAVYAFAIWPVLIVGAIAYFAIWPPLPAFAHLALMMLVALIVVDRALRNFRKPPFACSYLPGKSDLRWKLGTYGIAFLAVTYLGALIENSMLETLARSVLMFAILSLIAWRSHSRWVQFASGPFETLQFEDAAVGEVSPLDLSDASTYARADQRYIDVLNAPPAPSLRSRVQRFAKRAAVVMAIAVCAGVVYEQVGEWQERRRFPQIGTSVDIGGRSLNIFCSGEGSPPVIFETGAGGIGYSWTVVQQAVAKVTRACWYDRAGYAWSDPGPYPRDSIAVARDLHQLLHNARVPAPYVLVGHSIGGFHVRVFHHLYPDETAAVVLADSSYEHEIYPDDDTHGGQSLPEAMNRFNAMLAQGLYRVGFLRLLAPWAKPAEKPRGLAYEQWVGIHAYEARVFAEAAKELRAHDTPEVIASGNLGDIPLLVLTAGLPASPGTSPLETRRALRRQQIWIGFQAELAKLSSRGRQVVVEDARHGMYLDDPEAVSGGVKQIVEEVRAQRF